MKEYSSWYHPYKINPEFKKRVAYFSMEFGIHQALKIYSGGLGFLAGSHMRSAYDLDQNVIGIGMLWKYGYYDQDRNDDQTMQARFREKRNPFLEDTGIVVTVMVNDHPVKVKAMVLKPDIFGTAPLYLLTTDLPENDHLARTITNHLYDNEPLARIAQSIVLGIGGAKVVEALGGTDLYHLNEAHALPLAFHLANKYNTTDKLREKLVFTTHTPEKAGNEEHDIQQLNRMGFFDGMALQNVREITGMHGTTFNYTLAALRLAKIANAVSQLHGIVSRNMWYHNEGVCEIKSITNAQNVPFWVDPELEKASDEENQEKVISRKIKLKKELFELVADQTGKLFQTNILTIVWARRFAAYKRADLIVRDVERFFQIIENQEFPVQIIWAGKPYPYDYNAVETFNNLIKLAHNRKNIAVLTGYEINLSKKLKQGADLWLNTPRRPQEASGTSGMTAAMNGAINFSIADGWIPEFARHGENSFIIPKADTDLPIEMQDKQDYENMIRILTEEIIPTYYLNKNKWYKIMQNSMQDVVPAFDSDRMATEYYKQLYNY